LVRVPSGLVAAYRDRTEEEIRDIAVARFENGRWSEPLIIGNDGWNIAGCPVNGPALSARRDTVVIAWFTAADAAQRVQFAMSTDGGVSFGEPVRIDDGTPVGRVDVELTERGALVVWMERVAADGESRAKLGSPRGVVSRPRLVATTTQARSSGFPRMVSVGNEVVFAWTETKPEPRVHVTSASWIRR
jgi:hypothetical protein